MKKLFYILLFVLAFLFYWNTGRNIENRTEAEDVYEYALMVEQGSDHPWFYHQHHLIYGSVMKLAYDAVQRLGYTGRAIGVMRIVSALSAAGTLFFFFLFCYKRFSLRPVSSFLSTLFLGVTYGFWRYSAESEIPLVASVFMIGALFFSTDPDARKRSFGLAVLFSVLSVLMHVMNAVAVFAAIPCFYLLRKRWKSMGLHLILSTILVVGFYAFVGGVYLSHGGGGVHFSTIGFGALVKAMIAFLQCIISCDFMMGFSSVRAFLGELFAGRMLSEEFYCGERLSRGHVLFSTVTFVMFILSFLACVFRAGWVWKNRAADRKQFRLPEGISVLVIASVFFFGYAGLLLFVEPGNPELWVMGLVPFCLLLCGLVFLPLTFDNRLWLPFLMVLTLFLHNTGAMRVLYDPSKDYQRQKSKTILEMAGLDDVIVTAGNPVFERYLRYYFEGEVRYLYEWDSENMMSNEILRAKGDVYILGDVFDQPKSLRVRFPEKTAQIDFFADRIDPLVEHVARDEFGGVFRVKSVDAELIP